MIRKRTKNRLLFNTWKTICLCLIGAWCSTTCLSIDTLPEGFDPFAAVSGPAPKIQFPITEHDFGTIAPGSKHEHKFKFSNRGDAILTINKTIRSSCGCAVPKLDKTDYKPGESGILLLKFNAKTLVGPTKKKLFIESNDPNMPAVTLWVKANILPPVKCTPPQILFFLDDPNLSAPQLILESMDGKEFGINQMLSTGNAFQLSFDPNNLAQKHIFQPTMDIPSVKQNPRGLINLNLSHPNYQLMRIPYMAIPLVDIQPVSVIIFGVQPNKPTIRTVTLRSNVQDRPIAIKELRAEQNTVKMDVKAQESDVTKLAMLQKLKIEITPPLPKTATKSFTDIVNIILTNGKTISVRVQGFYAPPKTVP